MTNADYMDSLSGSNIDAAKLKAIQANFTQLETLDKAQMTKNAEAQQATEIVNYEATL